MEKDRPPSRAERFWAGANARGIPLQAIVATVAIVAATYLAGKLLYRLRDVVLLLLVAAFIAVLLNPLVAALQNRGLRRRGMAVCVVIVLAVLVFAGLAAAFGIPLARGITHLAHAMPAYVAKAQQGRGWAGHLVRQYHVAAWVRRNEPKLIRFGQEFTKPALTVGKGAASLLAALATVFVLVVLLLLEGPALMQGALNAMSPAHGRRFSRIAGEASRAATGYMAGNCATSLIAGIVVFVTLVILRVPFPLVWGLWVALVDLLPMVGGALAGIPTVLFAAAHSLTAGIVTAVVFAVYTQIENHVLNPVVMSKTVRISPLLVLLSVLAGASIGGWLGGIPGGFAGALLAIPTAAALQTVIRDLWRDTAPASSPSSGNSNLPACNYPARIRSPQLPLAPLGEPSAPNSGKPHVNSLEGTARSRRCPCANARSPSRRAGLLCAPQVAGRIHRSVLDSAAVGTPAPAGLPQQARSGSPCVAQHCVNPHREWYAGVHRRTAGILVPVLPLHP